MPKQFIVRLYKNAPPGSTGSELVANSQVITIEGLGSTAVTARDFVDGQLTGTVTTGGQIGVFYKRLSQPLWTVVPVSDSVNAGTSFTFNVTVNLPYTENLVKWYVVDVGTEIPYSGGGIPNTSSSIIFSGSGTTASFVVLTTPIQTIQSFQIVLVNGNLGTNTVLARSSTCFISPIILSIVPASPQQRKFGENANFTVNAYPYEQISWSGASTGVGVTNGSGIYIGTLGTTLAPGVNSVTFQGNITNQELLYTVNVTSEDILLVTGPDTATVGQSVPWTIRGKANQLVYWTGQHDVNDSGSANTGAGNVVVNDFGKLQSGTYTWKFRGDGVPNVVTKQLILTPISGLSVNYNTSGYLENDPINVTVSAALGDTITWTYIPATLLQPAYFDYYPDVAEAYNNTQGLVQVATTIIGVRNNIKAAQFAEEVQGYYQTYLKRFADQNGLDYWVNTLVNDLSQDLEQIRALVKSSIQNSDEAKTVATTGSRIASLSTLEYAQEHYRLYGSSQGRISPADLSVRENNFPATGNSTVMTGVTSKSVDVRINNPNLIPRTTPYTFRFTGISSSPAATAAIKIIKKYSLNIVPDQYPSASKLTNNAIILITVFGAPGEYVTVTPATSPGTFIHTFTMENGQYTFDLLQYAKKVLAAGGNLPNATYTMVFEGNKTTETPTYTFEVTASAALNISTNQAPRVSEGDAIPVSISGAPGEKISWTYTIPSNFQNVSSADTGKQGDAFFELYQGVAEAYTKQTVPNNLTRFQFADALYKQYNLNGASLYMSPFNALTQILTNPPRSGTFQNLTNSSGVLSINLAADLNLPARASPYSFTFSGNISTGTPSINVTVLSPQILELVVPSQGYVNEPILINIVGMAGETVVLTRNPATNSTVTVALNTNGSKGDKQYDIASGTTFAPGVLTITAKGNKTINFITKTIQIYNNISDAPAGTVDGLGMSLTTFVQMNIAGGVIPEFAETGTLSSRWYATNTKNNISYTFANAAEVQIKASPGYAYNDGQSFIVRDWTQGGSGTFEHIPGKSLTYRLFARNGTRYFNTGEIDTNNKPSIYVPGFRDSTFFVTSPYSYGTGTNAKIYFTVNRYVLWRKNTKPSIGDQYNYIIFNITAESNVVDRNYNIEILDASTNTAASYLKATKNLSGATDDFINTLTSGLDTIYIYPNPDYAGTSGPISANVVIRSGSILNKGSVIGWKIVTLLDPNQSTLPTGSTASLASTITTPLTISVENANAIYTGTAIKLNINYIAGRTLAIYAGFNSSSLSADSSRIKEITLTSNNQTVEVSGGLTISGNYYILVRDVANTTESKSISVPVQTRNG